MRQLPHNQPTTPPYRLPIPIPFNSCTETRGAYRLRRPEITWVLDVQNEAEVAAAILMDDV